MGIVRMGVTLVMLLTAQASAVSVLQVSSSTQSPSSSNTTGSDEDLITTSLEIRRKQTPELTLESDTEKIVRRSNLSSTDLITETKSFTTMFPHFPALDQNTSDFGSQVSWQGAKRIIEDQRDELLPPTPSVVDINKVTRTKQRQSLPKKRTHIILSQPRAGLLQGSMTMKPRLGSPSYKGFGFRERSNNHHEGKDRPLPVVRRPLKRMKIIGGATSPRDFSSGTTLEDVSPSSSKILILPTNVTLPKIPENSSISVPVPKLSPSDFPPPNSVFSLATRLLLSWKKDSDSVVSR